MAEAILRDEFPILRRSTYLNTCSLGAFSRSTGRRVRQFYKEWSERGAPAWYTTWWRRLEQTRATFARLIGARVSEVAILPSVSAALTSLASALDYRRRQRILTTRLDFPTISYAWRTNPHARLRFIGPTRGVEVPLAAYEVALDDSVAAVATSHVFYATGALQDAKAISRRAHRHGALSILDAYHAVGQVPIDVRELGCDALVSGGLKWLLGGPGCALLYVRRALHRRLVPAFTGWFANERQFDFDPAQFAFRRTAQRFELGTPSLPSVFATLGGMDLVARVGPARIRRRQDALVTDLYEKLTDAGYRVRTPPDPRRRAGILMVEVRGAERAVERLARRRIVVDHRNGRIRVSPYFYNDERDHDRFVEALRRAAPARG